jgi:hypothetical protein
MGKRELLLILAFVVVGVIVYQVSAPPAKGGGFSLGEFARKALREVRSESASAEHKSTAVHPLTPSVQEVRVRGVQRVTVIGEPRADIATELDVTSSGIDKAEAETLAAAATLRADTTSDAIAFSVEYPQDGRQQAHLTLRVPSSVRARLEDIRGEVRASDIAGVYLASTRAETTLTNINGPIEGEHRGGDIAITGGADVRLRLRSVDLRMERIIGSTVLDMTGGELKAGILAGPVEIEARSADIEVESASGPVKVNAVGGRVTLGGLRQSVRCDGQRTDVRLRLDTPATVTAFTSDGTLELTAPKSGGLSLDAAATGGDIRLDGFELPVQSEGATKRATGPLAGGGPTVSLRTNGGAIVVRAAGGS